MKKMFIQHGTTISDFKKTVDDLSKNTLTFENSSIMERYKEKEIKHFTETELNLVYHRNIILEKYGDYLRNTAKRAILLDDSESLYTLNPFLASARELGTTEYWWLMLYVNECLSVYDFKDFKSVLMVPNIKGLITKIKYDLVYNDLFGVLIE